MFPNDSPVGEQREWVMHSLDSVEKRIARVEDRVEQARAEMSHIATGTQDMIREHATEEEKQLRAVLESLEELKVEMASLRTRVAGISAVIALAAGAGWDWVRAKFMGGP